MPTTLVPLAYYSGTTFEPLAYAVTVAGTAAVVAAVSFFYYQNRYIILWTKKAFARRSHQAQAGGTAKGLPPPPSWHPRSLRALKRIEASMIELTYSSARINQPTKSVLSSNQCINYKVQTNQPADSNSIQTAAQLTPANQKIALAFPEIESACISSESIACSSSQGPHRRPLDEEPQSSAAIDRPREARSHGAGLFARDVHLRASAAPVDAAHALQQNDPSAMGPHRRILQHMIQGFVFCASSFLSLPPLFHSFNASLPVSRR